MQVIAVLVDGIDGTRWQFSQDQVDEGLLLAFDGLSVDKVSLLARVKPILTHPDSWIETETRLEKRESRPEWEGGSEVVEEMPARTRVLGRVVGSITEVLGE